MNLMYIHSNLAKFAGVEIVLTQKINWLVRHGYNIVVFLYEQNKEVTLPRLHPDVKIETPEVFFFRSYGVPLYKRPIDYLQRCRLFKRKLHESIAKYEPDVVLTPSMDLIAMICDVCKQIPVIAEMHNNEGSHILGNTSNTWLGDIRREWYRKRMKKASALAILTQGDKNDWKKYVNSDKIHIIPNVVRLNESEKVSDCSRKHVIFAGRITYQKGIDYLVEAWRMVYKQHPDWTLDIYGKPCSGTDFEYQQILDSCKDELNITQHLPTSEIMEKYMESSVFVLASRYEAFGLVLPEAMSCGLPVVSFDCPYGPRDIITDGKDGFLIPLGDVKMLAERINYLIENPAVRMTMGENGRVSSKRFAEENIMPLWEQLINKIANKSI